MSIERWMQLFSFICKLHPIFYLRLANTLYRYQSIVLYSKIIIIFLLLVACCVSGVSISSSIWLVCLMNRSSTTFLDYRNQIWSSSHWNWKKVSGLMEICKTSGSCLDSRFMKLRKANSREEVLLMHVIRK